MYLDDDIGWLAIEEGGLHVMVTVVERLPNGTAWVMAIESVSEQLHTVALSDIVF